MNTELKKKLFGTKQMNERLRQFERESKLEIYGLGAKRIPWEAALEKYAELIVRECVLISQTSTDGFSAGQRMEEHFGVKE